MNTTNQNKNNLKKILIPIDFTPQSEVGLKTGLSIAVKTGADLSLFHAIDEPEAQGFRTDADMEAARRENNKKTHFVMELMKARNSDMKELVSKYSNEDVKITYDVEVGKYKEVLKDYIKKHPQDLIIMGTSGHRNFEEIFKGNHAFRTVIGSDIPVLAVKKYEYLDKSQSMMILLDLEKEDPVSNTTSLYNFARILDLNLHITCIVSDDNVQEKGLHQKIEKMLKDAKINNYALHLVKRNELIKKINDLVSNLDITIVANVADPETGWMKYFTQDDTEKMLLELDSSVLAVAE